MSRFKAAVFDWAGTMIDFGSFAPMGAFVEAFGRFDIQATFDEARQPMGLPKRDHVKAMLAMPSIAAQWTERHGHPPTENDIDAVYRVFVPINEEVVADYAELVPGGREAIDALRARGLKIGSTTGYTRSIMERVLPLAAQQGYAPDNLVCSDDLIEGRPGPLGMYKCFVDLGVYPPSAVIKVDDTEPGIGEGVSAGCLTVGVALSSNHVGMTPDQLAATPAERVAELRAAAAEKLTAAGADHIIDTVADLPALIDRLDG